MFAQMPQPLDYAETLLGQYDRLVGLSDSDELLGSFVGAAAELSGCELAQLYLLDAARTHLGLTAEYLEPRLQPRDRATLPTDYRDQQLLQYSLCQGQPLALAELNPGLHDTSFLPEEGGPWRALLCLPLRAHQGAIRGLLLCATRQARELAAFTGSLERMGRLMLAQLDLFQRLQPAARGDSSRSTTPRPCARGFGLIGESKVMRQTYRLIGKVLHSPYTVLIHGETGTGKELVARAIHDYGPRREAPFIVQNCSALPEQLLESELFGYRKGAFTGADADREGLLDAANGGTLFLDEIGDMPLALQAKLLRVLQEGEVRPLGTPHPHRIDVRIIAATHRDLQAMIAAGEFREDLFYRLCQFPIELPPLRQRGEDIPHLARHFANQACRFLQRSPCLWSEEALERLARHPFPGNVRELKALVERAVLLCDGELLPSHFSLRGTPLPSGQPLSLRERLDHYERGQLIDALRRHDGNRAQAARELGLPRRTLLYRMDRLGIGTADL
ncbi:AAA domain-containing protein [Pseudomonas otitidis]|uniref:AAA domain-containing protein n=1 Tax=Metapseudomonas otitidis TaxID=319939 RepID=A0A7X3H3A5_9GAMM|nr:sigma 54-interacting transcriptional regulator [Pseudomonas otitidis]MWK54566.1 AAA domain-containing protein [Pseudomonas otitidis]